MVFGVCQGIRTFAKKKAGGKWVCDPDNKKRRLR